MNSRSPVTASSDHILDGSMNTIYLPTSPLFPHARHISIPNRPSPLRFLQPPSLSRIPTQLPRLNYILNEHSIRTRVANLPLTFGKTWHEFTLARPGGVEVGLAHRALPDGVIPGFALRCLVARAFN
jgi:hypothetical protein